MSGIPEITAVSISGALTCGMALSLLALLKRDLALGAEPGQSPPGPRLLALNLLLVPLLLLGGILVDHLGIRVVVLAGSMALALGLFGLSVRPALPKAFAALALAALGGAGLGIATVVLMPKAFFGSLEATASVNLGCVFFTLGALVTPPLIDVLERAMGLRKAVTVLAFLALVPALPAALAGEGTLDLPELSADQPHLLEQEAVWLAALVFFFYAPLEALIATGTATHLLGRAQQEGRPVWIPGFWVCFVGSRLLTALLQHARWLTPEWDAWLLVLLALLAGVVLGNLSGSTRRGAARFGLLFLGLVLGPIFPTLVGIVLRPTADAPESPGTACGLLFALGSLGSMVIGSLVVGRDPRQPVRLALRLPMLLALVVTAVALVFVLTAP
jgi:hypothetical protein